MIQFFSFQQNSIQKYIQNVEIGCIQFNKIFIQYENMGIGQGYPQLSQSLFLTMIVVDWGKIGTFLSNPSITCEIIGEYAVLSSSIYRMIARKEGPQCTQYTGFQLRCEVYTAEYYIYIPHDKVCRTCSEFVGLVLYKLLLMAQQQRGADEVNCSLEQFWQGIQRDLSTRRAKKSCFVEQQ